MSGKLTIEEVLDECNPKKLPNGQLRMQCPFRENHEGINSYGTGDGSNSFFVTPDINAYHCFSCKEHGNLANLLVNRFDVPYFEAVEMVNILPMFDKEEKEKVKFELDFRYDLITHNYFVERGFDEKVMRDFFVGQMMHTTKKGNKMVVIVIPLYDHLGVLQGVKYRVPDAHDFWYSDNFERAKYIYNYNPKAKKALLVEGETDLYRVVGWGYDYAMSPLKGEVSDEQADMLIKIPLIQIAFDCDIAGIKGAKSAYDKLSPYTEVEFINYPAKDPDACNEIAFHRAVMNPCNYAEFLSLTELEVDKKKNKKYS